MRHIIFSFTLPYRSIERRKARRNYIFGIEILLLTFARDDM